MTRRDWLRRAAIIAGGVIAADQIELIERLTPKRYVNGWAPPMTATEIGENLRVAILKHQEEMRRYWQKELAPMLKDQARILQEMERYGFTMPDHVLYGTGKGAPRGLITLASGT